MYPKFLVHPSNVIQVPTTCIPWPSNGLRRISINSFGFGNSNSHVVLDDARHYLEKHGLHGHHRTRQYPASMVNGFHTLTNGIHASEEEDANPTQILCFTGKDQAALQRSVEAYAAYMSSGLIDNACKLRQLAFTLTKRRTRFPWRSFAILKQDSRSNLLDVDKICSAAVRAEDSKTGLAFIFSGQGAQYRGMGKQLLIYPAFDSMLRAMNSIFKSLGAEWDIVG